MSARVVDSAGARSAGVVPQRLRPPRQPAASLQRTVLLDRLACADRPIVTVEAGAGYGKTTLLRQWIESQGLPAGWVGLDATDDDPVVLLRHLVAALADCGVDMSAVECSLAGSEPQLSRAVMPALAAALEAADQPFVLVLDDVHVVSGRESLAVIDELLDLVPGGATVGLGARWFPPIGLPRRFVDGRGVGFGQADLAFRADEAMTVVARELPALSEAQLGDLVQFLEGWPAGVHLAVLALRDHPRPDVVVERLVVTDRRVTDYLHEEVLDRLDPEVREVLVRTSVLQRLRPALCDAVLERDGSAEVLEQLDRSGNLFVHRDELSDEYRLHELFREMLLGELRRREPGAEAGLRRRAARWHHEHGDRDDAVVQAVATGDLRFAADMLDRQLVATMVGGELGTLGRWLSLFPPEELRSNGLLALCAGWHAVGTGRIRDLALHLADARTAAVESPLPDGSADLQVGLDALEMVADLDGTAAVARRARRVVEAGPGAGPWSGLAAHTAAVAESLLGRVDPVDALAAAEPAARGMPMVHVACQAQLGWALLRRGDRQDGLDWVRRAEAELRANRLEDFSLAAVVHAIISWARSLEGDLDGSEQAAATAERSLDTLRHLAHRGRLHCRLVLADAALQRGQVGEARRQLERCRELLRTCDAVVLADFAEELVRAVDREQRSVGVVELTAAESRVLAQLPTHRSLVEIGDHLYVSRNTVKTHTLSIYRKLGVSSRSDAVERATELGLITPTG